MRNQDAWSSAHSFARDTLQPASWACRATAAHMPSNGTWNGRYGHGFQETVTEMATGTDTETATWCWKPGERYVCTTYVNMLIKGICKQSTCHCSYCAVIPLPKQKMLSFTIWIDYITSLTVWRLVFWSVSVYSNPGCKLTEVIIFFLLIYMVTSCYKSIIQ